MQSIDHSIYFKQKGLPDYGEAISRGMERGMSMGQMINRQRDIAEEKERKSQMRDLLGKSFVTDDKGNTSFDYNRLSDMANINPDLAMKLENQNYSRRQEEKRFKADDEYKKKMIALKEREMKNKKSKLANQFTPAQKKVDETYAKDYNDWKAQGGYSTITRNLNDARAVANKLMNSDGYSGKLDGMFGGTAIQDYVNSKGADLQDMINRIVMGSLRATLGAQFTEKEGKRVLEATYNPRQDEKVNARRIIGLVGELEEMAKAKEASAKYYEQHGTLVGYKGPEFNLDKFRSRYAVLDQNKGGASGGWGISQARAAEPHPQAKQALEWAKNNPQDPRAKTILQRLGR